MTFVDNSTVTSAIAHALRAVYADSLAAAKELGRKTGRNAEAARNWLEGRNAPNAATLIALMAEHREVFDAVVRLAGRQDNGNAADRERVLAQVDELRRLLERLP